MISGNFERKINTEKAFSLKTIISDKLNQTWFPKGSLYADVDCIKITKILDVSEAAQTIFEVMNWNTQYGPFIINIASFFGI